MKSIPARLVPAPLRRWWREQNRYELDVPEDIRRLAEAHGVPKPARYIPSAQGAPVRISAIAHLEPQAEVEGWTHG